MCGVDQAEFVSEGQSQSFWVSEFVRLANGRLVILHDARGFSVGPPVGPGASGEVGGYTRRKLTETVLAVVLPDPEDGEEHPWSLLTLLARTRGLDVTAEDLRGLPYEVVFTEGLTQSLLAS